MRTAGLVIFNLPGRSSAACRFADSLKGGRGRATGRSFRWDHKLWGFALPVYSTFAGNPYFIDPDSFLRRYCQRRIKAKYDFGKDEHRIDYGKLYEGRLGSFIMPIRWKITADWKRNIRILSPSAGTMPSGWRIMPYICLSKGGKGLPGMNGRKGIREHDEEALAGKGRNWETGYASINGFSTSFMTSGGDSRPMSTDLGIRLHRRPSHICVL